MIRNLDGNIIRRYGYSSPRAFEPGKPFGLDCNGSSDYVSVPYFVIGGNTTASIYLWIKLKSIPASTKRFFARSATGSVWSVIWGINSTGTVQFGVSSGTDYYTNSAGTLATGRWYGLTLTAAPSNTCKFYINGAQDSNVTSSLASGFTFRGTSPVIHLGGWQMASEYASCILGPVAVFSSLHAAADVAYWLPRIWLLSGYEPSLAWAMRCDEGAGTTTRDLCAGGYNGTLNGPLWRVMA